MNLTGFAQQKTAEHFDDDPPDFYSPGSEEEAQIFFAYQASAWLSNPPAMLWLIVTALPWLIKNGYQEAAAP